MGLEPIANSPICSVNPQIAEPGAPKALPANPSPAVVDPDLDAVTRAWPVLSAPIRAAVLAVVRAGKVQR
jgi:hypothetical protein